MFRYALKSLRANLTRLVPKAVRTLELVMADDDAPPGIRAKAADSVLDRTGYAKGVDVRIDAAIAVVDTRGILKDRLDALRDARKVEAARTVAGSVLISTVDPDGTPTSAPEPDPPA